MLRIFCHYILSRYAKVITKGHFETNMKHLFTFLIFSLSVSAYADVVSRDNLELTTWHPSSVDRHHAPSYNGVIRVYFKTSAPWGNTNCRQDAADIRSDDQVIISSMLAAFMANKKVKVEVNNSLPTLSDVCKVTAVFIKN